MTLFDYCKTALRRVSDDDQLDAEINLQIDAAFDDLGITGILDRETIEDKPLAKRAVITYVLMVQNIGEDSYSKLKASYDEQKAQMSMNSNYTDWGGRA